MRYKRICVFLLFLVACESRPSYLIEEDKLIPLIVDLHVADALFTNRGILDQNIDKMDSASYYRYIFEKYDVTRIDFDSTMQYLTARPKKIDAVYEEVLNRLSIMEAEAAELRDKEMEMEEEELWTKSERILLPQDSGRNEVSFSLPAEPGTYRINASIRLFPDDETKSPRFVSYFWYDDGSKDGRKFNERVIYLRKNNRLERYTVTKRLINQEDAYLKGAFIAHDNTDSTFTKHAVIDNISISYKPLP